MEIKPTKKAFCLSWQGKEYIQLLFNFSNSELLSKVNKIVGRCNLSGTTGCFLKLTPEAIKNVKNIGFSIDENLESYLQKAEKKKADIISAPIQGLKRELFPYQKEGVAFIEHKNGKCLIADEPGLGKTGQSLAWLQLNREKIPAIIVVPASLKLNWKIESEMWMTDPKTTVINGTKTFSLTGMKRIIINYDILFAWVEELRAINPQVLILDEAHYFKSTSAKRTKAVKKLAKGIPNIICLTGTPVLNKPIELYNIIKLINPELFPNFKAYQKRYCGLRYNGFGWESNGASHLPELNRILNEVVMIRRMKKDVLKDLPDKLFSFVPIELTNEKEYRKAEADFITWIHNERGPEAAMKAKSAEALTKMETLKQLAVKGKMGECINWIDDFLETEQKLVVFASHKNVIAELMERYKDVAVKIDGSCSQNERQKAVESFQKDDKIRLFVGNIQAAGVGITLTASSNVAFIEYPFSPAMLDQAMDRCILKGELVLTKSGYKPIESIKIGDLVYTHLGNWKKVINTKTKLERTKSFYDIKYKGFYKPLRCTEDHKIYIFNLKTKTYEWVMAKDLNINNHAMTFPKVNTDNYKKEFNVNSYASNSSRKLDINLNPNLSSELLFAFGFYVGNGWCGDHQVNICDDKNDRETLISCINTIKNEFNIETHSEYKKDNAITMYISSKELKNNFISWFGEGAFNKTVPDFIFNLSNEQIKSFLDGYYKADGYRRKNTQQASTVSELLAYQIILLEGLLENSTSLRYNPAATCWSLEYSIKDQITHSSLIKNDNGNSIFPISEIKIYKPKRNEERVYDLTVEDDHSFIVGLASVHNCHRIGQKDNVTVHYLLASNTIEDKLAHILDRKRKVVDAIMDGKETENESLIVELMKMYVNEKQLQAV